MAAQSPKRQQVPACLTGQRVRRDTHCAACASADASFCGRHGGWRRCVPQWCGWRQWLWTPGLQLWDATRSHAVATSILRAGCMN